MTSKVLVYLLLVCAASCQQQQSQVEEDDGSYNPDKYEKPYANLGDDNPAPSEPTTPVNQFLATFQQSPQFQLFQQQQQQLLQQQQQQQQPPPPPPPPPPQQQQQQQQPNPFLQSPQNIPPVQQPQIPRTPVPNPFPQNPFFQQLRNPQPQPQVPSFQSQNPPFQPQNQAPQSTPRFQQASPLFQSQQEQRFSPPTRDPAPVNQITEGVEPSINYQTEDGIQRTETIDSDGTVRGQYSYVDPDGKTITVRYSAGKDGFKVEGDNIPSSPQRPEVSNELQPQPLSQPQLRFPQPQPQSAPQQFNAIPPQLGTQRSRFNNPSPPQQQFFNEPEPPRPRSRFVNGIYQPSFQRSVPPAPVGISQESQGDFEFQNRNRDFGFQARFP